MHNKLIKDIGTIIENKILILSEEEVDQILSDINTSIDNAGEYNELYVLEKLQTKFEDKTVYYQIRLHKKYDWNSFKYGIPILIIAVILAYILYIIITCYDLPKHRELNELIQELKNHGIMLTKCSEGHGIKTSYCLEVATNTDFLTDHAHDLLEQAIEVHASIYGWIKRTMLFLFGTIFISIICIFSCVVGWLWPEYKQYYEKWYSIEKKLKARISVLKQQS